MNCQHTLITFIGRSKPDPKTRYRLANYRFPECDQPETTADFGLALSNYLEPKPDLVVILGTDGSQWGVLVENLAQRTEEEDARLVLLEAESVGSVTQAMLEKVAQIMSPGFGAKVLPRLIPVGEDEQQQVQILEAISASVRSGEVSIDVTHGSCYFGMIGFLSALMLEQVNSDLRVRQIWYGALDLMRSKVTPVLQLKGLSRVQA